MSGNNNVNPNWLGTPPPVVPNNQQIVNGKVVNVVPIVDLDNHSISSVTANTKTLVWTTPTTWAAGVYLINAEFQVQNTGGGQTAFAAGDGVDWIVQGIGDPATDYAEASGQPYYGCVAISTGTGGASTNGVFRMSPSGLTQITNDNTAMGVYVRYLSSAGTKTMTFNVTNLSIQKIA